MGVELPAGQRNPINQLSFKDDFFLPTFVKDSLESEALWKTKGLLKFIFSFFSISRSRSRVPHPREFWKTARMRMPRIDGLPLQITWNAASLGASV